MTVYTVALSKGGSTKTTTAAELVAALAARGRKVLAIDLDSQANLTTRMGLTPDSEVEGTAADLMMGEAVWGDVATRAPSVPGAYVAAGSDELTLLDHKPEVITALRDRLPTVGEWGDVVIDTPPALSIVTLAALAAADTVVAAAACETEAFDQLDRLTEAIDERIARMVTGQRLHWIVPTRHDGRRVLDREVLDVLGERYPGRVTSPVREAVAARDAYTAGMPVSVYAPGSGIAGDYAAALASVIGDHQ